MNVSMQQVRQVLSSKYARLELSFNGVGTDGGPTCASLKPPAEWIVVTK
jgi:hypothetical protein